jgi:insulysin
MKQSQINIPINEKRKFKYLILPNKIKCVIIQDVDDIANVSVSIKAGSADEPYDCMGLAHFLEHMLFLGTNKYKKESYYNEILNKLGGSSNAYTALFETVYYFNVINPLDNNTNKTNLETMLDIFSQFFIDPLFNEDSVEREINAIESEHKKNLNEPLWIGRQIIYNLSEKKSGINRFTTGTKKSLGIDSNNLKPSFKKLRNKMIEFYNSYYCSNNMCLTIQSNEDIETVEKYIDQYFSIIPMKKAKKNNIIKFNKFSKFTQEYQLIPSNDSNDIIYFWQVPTINSFFNNKAINIVNDIIEYNGPNNLENILKKKGLCNYIYTWYLTEGIYMLKVNISNLHNIENQINFINIIVANYFNNFLPNLDWNKYYLYEKNKYKTNYNYNDIIENSELVNIISNNLHYYEPKYVYSGNYLIISKDNENNINSIKKLVAMLHFNKVNIIYSTHNILDKNAASKFIKDKYYFNKYGKINKTFIKDIFIKDIFIKDIKFSIDIDIDFLNIKPTIKTISSKFKIPSKYKNIWYGGTMKTFEPVVSGFIFIYKNTLINNIDKYVCTVIACNLLNHYIAEIFTQQFELGYTVFFSLNNDGIITISINGLNYKYKEFFYNVLDKIKNINLNKTIVDITIDKIKNDFINITKMSPWDYSYILINTIQYKYNYNYINLINSISNLLKLNYIDIISNHIKIITNISDLPSKIAIYGNILQADLPIIKSTISNKIISKPSPITNITVKHPNKNEINKLIMYAFPCGSAVPFNPKDSSIAIILSMLLDQPSYQQLRTINQLGYLVKSYLYTNNFNFYIVIKIQTDLNIKFVENKIVEFLDWFKKYLNTLDIKIFEDIKKSATALVKNKPTSIDEYVNSYIGEIKYNTYIFNKSEQLIKYIDKIQLLDIINLYKKLVKKKFIIKII